MSNKETYTSRRKTADRANIPKSQQEAYTILNKLRECPSLIPDDLSKKPTKELMKVCSETIQQIHVGSASLRAYAVDTKREIENLANDVKIQSEMLNRLYLDVIMKAINILFYTNECVRNLVTNNNRKELSEILRTFNHLYKILANEKRSIETMIDTLKFISVKIWGDEQ